MKGPVNRRVVCIGECMVEMMPAGKDFYRRGFSGDTFNAAWYLRRQLPADWSVGYVTAVGLDPLSDEMFGFFERSGITTEAVRRVPDRTVGLYMIALRDGERSFTYWRGEAAARFLAADAGWLAGRLAGADVVLLSGITVAIVPAEHRPNLLAALRTVRAAGGSVVFDPNLRPRLWSDSARMRAAIEAAAREADVVLPSFEDEAAHFGDPDPAATLARYRAWGAATVVVKNGPGTIHAWDVVEGEAAHTPEPVAAIDTTAAGDSFNAGLLAARLRGAPLPEALACGARLAAAVVRAPGALVEVGTGTAHA